MNFLNRTPGRRLAAWSVPLIAGLLASCGGGGGNPDPTLSGEVRGLAPGGVLVMSVSDASQSFATSVFVPSIPLSFSRRFFAGENYSITVQSHPAGQICAVLRGASGRLDDSIDNVLVECHTTRLNDTGIQAASEPGITDLAPDSRHGRDAEAARLTKVGSGAFGFDFTKVCPSGDLVDSVGGCPGAVNWACVRDNVTGLMWRRDDVAYEGSVPLTLASERLCNVTNWRPPTVHELLSIVHAGKSAAPHADTDFFKFDPSERVFFTSESHLGAAGQPWVVDFGSAGASGFANGTMRARWVSGTSALDDPAPNTYQTTIVNDDYVIIDTSRELMWLAPKALPQGTWTFAVNSVAGVNAAAPGGYTDWRLPNRSELDSLINRSRSGPAMVPVVASAIGITGSSSVSYWSASTSVLDLSLTQAWVVDFSFGDISQKLKGQEAGLIYVRNRAFNNAP